MKLEIIQDCEGCHHRGHTGNIGGKAKPMCRHPEAVKARLGTNGGLSKLTLTHKYPTPPKWCPLADAPAELCPEPKPESTRRFVNLRQSC